MKQIVLNYENLTELTEDNLILFCHLKDFKPEQLEILNLTGNYLKSLDFIQSDTPFINLKELYLGYNENLTDINNIKYLKDSLEELSINKLKLKNEKETLEILKNMKNLNILFCYNVFENYTIEQLKKELPDITLIYKKL